jgi:hypothetical protein
VPEPPVTGVSKPSGKPVMKSYAFACRAASSMSSRDAPGAPYAIFSAIDASNNVGS